MLSLHPIQTDYDTHEGLEKCKVTLLIKTSVSCIMVIVVTRLLLLVSGSSVAQPPVEAAPAHSS